MLSYPGLNRMALELVEALHAGNAVAFDAAGTRALRRCLEQKNRADADFWSIVGLIEIDLYEAIGAQQLSKQLDDLLNAYTDLSQRVSSPQLWSSVVSHTGFVLDAYLPRAPQQEAGAVKHLKRRLRTFAAHGTNDAESA